ncbi:MAG: hypothetical protein RRX88_06935 [Raoultibacter sp.]
MDNKEKGEYGSIAQALAGLPIDDAEKSSFEDRRRPSWRFGKPGEGKSYAEKRAILDKNGENDWLGWDCQGGGNFETDEKVEDDWYLEYETAIAPKGALDACLEAEYEVIGISPTFPPKIHRYRVNSRQLEELFEGYFEHAEYFVQVMPILTPRKAASMSSPHEDGFKSTNDDAFCSLCKGEINIEDRYCKHCGEKVQ